VGPGDPGGGVAADVAVEATHLSSAFTSGDARFYRIAKRTVDVVMAALAIVLLSPLLLLIAAAIRLDSPGRVIFAQERIGGRRRKDGRGSSWVVHPFVLFKFRTMEVGASDALHRDYMSAYLNGDEGRLRMLRPDRKDGESYRPSRDPRLTRVGALLRKLSLDELPQLWNVVRGEMSLVGPRPPMPYEVEMYKDRHLPRLAVLPGLTGLAQVRGRAAIGFEDTVRWDLVYLQRRSLWLDTKILLMTIPAVLTRRGAG
jgi:lipopolysaccharide/colanic/teichoic acid biosynthesis glycosyltransferase